MTERRENVIAASLILAWVVVLVVALRALPN